MRRMWAASAAMLVCLAVGAPALAQDASPVPAQDEVLYEITVPPEAIPDALGKIVVDEWTVDSGIDVSIPYDNEGILGRGMYLESGGLTVTPAYDALLWKGQAARGDSPVSAPAGEGVSLAAGDVLLLPAVPREELDPTAEVGIANPGTSDALVFAFHMHWWENWHGWARGIRGTQGITFGWPDELARVQAGDTTFRLTRLTLRPGETLPFPDDAAFVFDYLKSGVLSDWTILGSGPKERAVDVERKEHIVSGDVPAEVLELAVMPSVGATEAQTEDEDTAAGGEASAGVELPAAVTGDEVCQSLGQGETRYEVGGVDAGREFVSNCNDTMSDPRVSGLFTNTFNWECDQSIERCVFWGTHVMDEPDRGWDCSWTGTDDPSGDNWGLVLGVCPGSGAYDGLTYIFQHVFDGPEDIGNGTSFHGVIYEGPPPPLGPLPVESPSASE